MREEKTVFLNGKIIGVGKDFSEVEAMAISNNRFLFFGKNKDATDFIDDSTMVVDLKGKYVTPKFFDSHVHLIEGGLSFARLDLSTVRSRKEFWDKLYCFSKKSESQWIVGMNWTERIFGGITPDKSLIDKVVSKRPVILYRMDLHTALLNSKALEITGINNNFKPPLGGKVEHISGEPTGIIKDSALSYVGEFIPKPTLEEKLVALQKGIEEAKKHGIAGVHEMLLNIEDLEVYRKYCKETESDDFFIAISIPINKLQLLSALDLSVCKNVKIVGVKGFADGSLGAKTAWFFNSYNKNKNNFGLPTNDFNSGLLTKNAIEADKAGLQVAIHAIGNRAVHEVLNIFEEVRKANPNSKVIHRIEHAQHIIPSDIKRFNKLNVIASMQPYHLFYDKPLIENLFGNEELEYSFPVKKLLKEKSMVIFGTDFPVVGINPINGINLIIGGKDRVISERDKISIQEAIKAYTFNAAKGSSFQESFSLNVGRRADYNIFSLNS